MPLPSLYRSDDKPQAWRLPRAMAYGAALGALAGLFKTLGPFRPAVAADKSFLASGPEILAAALGFALLCAAAAALRNFIARRLIWR